jgi:hypothetical protein
MLDEIDLPRTESMILEEQQPMTIEKMYHRILYKAADSNRKGCGKFQWLMCVCIMFGLSGFGYLEYGLGFYELFP